MSSRKKEKKKDKSDSSNPESLEKISQTVATPSKEPAVNIEESTTEVTNPVPIASTSTAVPSDEVEISLTKQTSGFVGDSQPPFYSPSSSTEKKGSKRSLIGYVHDVSPLKRNRRNTVDYFQINLQTENCDKLKTVCYEKSKRPLFQAREETKTPVKLTNFTMSTTGDAVFVNSMTHVTQPQQGEYSFQYKSTDQLTQLNFLPLKHVTDSCAAMDIVNVKAKLLKKNPERLVGKDNLRLAEAVIGDGASTIKLDIWQDNIALIQEGKVYAFTALRVREWRKEVKLSASKEAKICLLPQADISGTQLDFDIDETSINQLSGNTVKVTSIISIESMNKFIQCVNCNKKILQDEGEAVVSCDSCGHRMNRNNCRKNMAANIVVAIDGQDEDLKHEPLRLTAFQDLLIKMCPEAADNMDIDYVSKLLLSLENFKLQYTSNHVITAVELGKEKTNE